MITIAYKGANSGGTVEALAEEVVLTITRQAENPELWNAKSVFITQKLTVTEHDGFLMAQWGHDTHVIK